MNRPIRKLVKAALLLPLRAVYLLPALLMRRRGFRVLFLSFPDRIGHLAIEVDWFLKQRNLGRYAGVRPILLVNRRRAANTALLEIWTQHLAVVREPLPYLLLRPLVYFDFLKIDLEAICMPVDHAACYQLLDREWGDRPPVFSIPPPMLASARRALEGLGVPRDAWFVCVHARDEGYSPHDEHVHSYRNCSMGSYELAVQAILDRGGWCVRMGEPGTAPLVERPGVVNYPDTSFRSDVMDLFLCANARFFLGNTSGLALVSTISGVPCALAHMAPLGASYGLSARDLSIPKLYRDDAGRLLGFRELFLSGIADYRYNRQFRDARITVVDNTAEQVRDLVVEMLDRLEGRVRYTDEDEQRQACFRSLFTPRNYMYGSPARIGRSFLREFEALLQTGPS